MSSSSRDANYSHRRNFWMNFGLPVSSNQKFMNFVHLRDAKFSERICQKFETLTAAEKFSGTNNFDVNAARIFFSVQFDSEDFSSDSEEDVTSASHSSDVGFDMPTRKISKLQNHPPVVIPILKGSRLHYGKKMGGTAKSSKVKRLKQISGNRQKAEKITKSRFSNSFRDEASPTSQNEIEPRRIFVFGETFAEDDATSENCQAKFSMPLATDRVSPLTELMTEISRNTSQVFRPISQSASGIQNEPSVVEERDPSSDNSIEDESGNVLSDSEVLAPESEIDVRSISSVEGQFSSDSSDDDDNDPVTDDDAKTKALMALSALKHSNICFTKLKQGTCSDVCPLTHKFDCDVILNYLCVVKYSNRFQELNEVFEGGRMRDRFERYISLCGHHANILNVESSLKIIASIAEDISRLDKIFLNSHAKIIKTFPRQLRNYFPNHLHVARLSDDVEELLVRAIASTIKFVQHWIARDAQAWLVDSLMDLYSFSFDCGILLSWDLVRETEDLLFQSGFTSQLVTLTEFYSHVPGFTANLTILKELISTCATSDKRTLVISLSRIMMSLTAQQIQENFDSTQLDDFVMICLNYQTTEFADYMMRIQYHEKNDVLSNFDPTLKLAMSRLDRNRNFKELCSMLARLPVSNTYDQSRFCLGYYRAMTDSVGTLKSDSLEASCHSLVNFLKHFQFFNGGRLVPVQKCFLSKLVASVLIFLDKKGTDRKLSLLVFQTGVECHLNPWNSDPLDDCDCCKENIIKLSIDLFTETSPPNGFELLTAKTEIIRLRFDGRTIFSLIRKLSFALMDFKSAKPQETEWLDNAISIYTDWISLISEADAKDCERIFNRIVLEIVRTYLSARDDDALIRRLDFVRAKLDQVRLEPGNIRALIYILYKDTFKKYSSEFYRQGQQINVYTIPEVGPAFMNISFSVCLTTQEYVIGLRENFLQLKDSLGKEKFQTLLMDECNLDQNFTLIIKLFKPQEMPSKSEIHAIDRCAVMDVRTALGRIQSTLERMKISNTRLGAHHIHLKTHDVFNFIFNEEN